MNNIKVKCPICNNKIIYKRKTHGKRIVNEKLYV